MSMKSLRVGASAAAFVAAVGGFGALWDRASEIEDAHQKARDADSIQALQTQPEDRGRQAMAHYHEALKKDPLLEARRHVDSSGIVRKSFATCSSSEGYTVISGKSDTGVDFYMSSTSADIKTGVIEGKKICTTGGLLFSRH